MIKQTLSSYKVLWVGYRSLFLGAVFIDIVDWNRCCFVSSFLPVITFNSLDFVLYFISFHAKSTASLKRTAEYFCIWISLSIASKRSQCFPVTVFIIWSPLSVSDPLSSQFAQLGFVQLSVILSNFSSHSLIWVNAVVTLTTSNTQTLLSTPYDWW